MKLIKESQKPIPEWLTKEIGDATRIWGQLIIGCPVDRIRPAYRSGHNPRQDPYVGIELVKNKLIKYGFIGVVPVVPLYIDPKTKVNIYELIDGDRRFLAWSELLCKPTIDIVIYEGSEKEIAPLRMAFNMDSEVSGADQAYYIYNVLIKRFGYTHEQIANICSQNSRDVGRSWVTMMASIGQNCSPEVLQAWREKKIKKTHALYISQTYPVDMKEKQLEMLSDIVTNKIKTSEFKKAPKDSNTPKYGRRNTRLVPKTTTSRNVRSPYELIKRYERLVAKNEKQPTADLAAVIAEYKWILSSEDV